jgi:uncharacterized tellurite resistance protein B-like protein
MLDTLKRFFSPMSTTASARQPHSEQNIQVAVCALFVEIARIDGIFSETELETVITILTKTYDLSPEHAKDLIAEADKALEKSVDLWQFARAINAKYTTDEKIEMIEMLWRVVYVDGKMEPDEHYLMNKLSNLLRLSHNQLIDAKLKVLRGRQGKAVMQDKQ